jgi:hypothetical protein
MHATYLSPANFFTVGAFFECRHAMGTDGIRRTGRRRESVSGRRALMTAPVRIHNPIDGDRFLRAEMKEAAKKSPLRQGAGAFVVSQDDN